MLAARGWTPSQLFSAGMFGICGGYCYSLALLFFGHQWILGAAGKPLPSDFLDFWAVGRATLSGHAASAYDPNALRALQTSIAGPFSGVFVWKYPPVFFFVSAALASLPYLSAFLGWVSVTVAAYSIAIGAIVRRWQGALAACASPVFLLAAFGGQNGFLTATLLAGFLLCLPRRPVVAGILLGLLTYKPQLGVLLPIALLAGRYWRTLGSAITTAVIAAGLAALAFGADAYRSFYAFLASASYSSLTLDGEGWVKIQSVYAIARTLGASDSAAWFAQGIVIAGGVATTIWLWRSELPYELKAAGLVVAAMLSTPYLHIYDFPMLLVPLAFLYRHRSFDRVEWIAAVLSNLLLLVFLAQITPVGPGILILIAALMLRRVVQLTGIAMPEAVPAT